MGVLTMLQLGARWAESLADQAETGMGYHVVSIYLKDGRCFDRVVLIGGLISSVSGSQEIPFSEEEIARIVVTHDKLPGP
jgi:hypothetical protein